MTVQSGWVVGDRAEWEGGGDCAEWVGGGDGAEWEGGGDCRVGG